MLDQAPAMDTIDGYSAWLAVVLVVAIASLVKIPSFGNRHWNFALPVLLAILTVTEPGLSSAVRLVVVAAATHVVTRRTLRTRLIAHTTILSVGSCSLLLFAWILVTAFVGASTLLDQGRGIAALFGTVLVWAVADGAMRRWFGEKTDRTGFLLGFLIADLLVGLAASGFAVVSAVLWVHAGVWAAVVAALPYVVTHRLLGALIGSWRVDQLAMRAIRRLPEAAGVVEADHSVAVERLAFQLGRLSGLRGRPLRELCRAAILHDIGLVTTSQQEVRRLGFSGRDVARWGVEILATSPSLASASRLIEGQADPFRVPGGIPDPSLDIRSQIIQLACRVHRFRTAGMSDDDLMNALNSDASFQISPELVRIVVPAMQNADREGDLGMMTAW